MDITKIKIRGAFCECKQTGQLQPGWAAFYDSINELPFVNHKPGECKCVNEIKAYIRDGKEVFLFSCCC